MVEIHKPPNTKLIDVIYVGMSEDENGFNGIIATIIEGFGGAPMVTASENVLGLFKAQALMMREEFKAPIKIYRFIREEVIFDTENPVG
jgi:hypothetical protein